MASLDLYNFIPNHGIFYDAIILQEFKLPFAIFEKVNNGTWLSIKPSPIEPFVSHFSFSKTINS
ncbi:hypothetical protein CR513_41486, partial [Mucuna pruriens]